MGVTSMIGTYKNNEKYYLKQRNEPENKNKYPDKQHTQNLTSMEWIVAIFCAIRTDNFSSASSLVSNGLASMYCSILPPGNIPCSFGPSPRSDKRVKMTDSVMRASSAPSPCV